MDLLKKLDFLSPTKTLNISREDRIKSLPGAVTSVIYVLFMILIMVVLILQYMKTDNPSINHQEERTEDFSYVNLVDARQMPVYLFLGDEGYLDYSQVVKMFNITGLKKNYTATHGKDYEYVSDSLVIETIPCATLMNDTDYFEGVQMSDKVRESLRSKGVCFDTRNASLNEELFVNGTRTDEHYDLMRFFIDPCNASISMACEPASQNILDSILVYRGSISDIVDNKNFKSPIKPVFNFDTSFRLYESTRLEITSVPVQTFVEDELGVPYGKRKAQTATSLQEIRSIYSPPSGTLIGYMRHEITAGNRLMRITRTYQSFIGAVATFGGIKEVVTVILTLFLSKFFSRSYKKGMVERVFDIKKNQEFHESFVCKEMLNEKSKSEKNSKSRTTGCFCCKKPRKSEVYEKKLEAAADLIEENLNVETIVRQLNTVSILSKMLLSETDELLVPPAALTMHQLFKINKKPIKTIGIRIKKDKAVQSKEWKKVVETKELPEKGTLEPLEDKPKFDEENPPIDSRKVIEGLPKSTDYVDPESLKITKAPQESLDILTKLSDKCMPSEVETKEVSALMRRWVEKQFDLYIQTEEKNV